MILDAINRFFVWMLRRLGGLTVIQISLLALALANVGWGMMAVIGRISAGPLVTVALVGMFAGWLLGITRLKGVGSVLLGLAGGLVYLALTVGRIGIPLIAYLRTLTPLAGQILHCTIWPSLKQIVACGSPDFNPSFETWKTLILTSTTLIARIGSWFKGVHSGILVVDPLVAPILWGTAIWLVATWAGWWVRRRDSVLIGLLPGVVLLGYNIYYTNKLIGIYSLVWAAGTMVLLNAANAYLRSERHWTSRRMDRVLIEPGLATTVALLVGTLMLAGALLPSLSIEKINSTIQKILHPSQDRTLAQSLGLQQVPLNTGKGKSGSGPVVISEVHAVGPGPHLGSDVIMYISVDGYNPLPPDIARLTSALEPDVTYYWRAQTYETYNGHVWITNNAQTVSLQASAPYYPNLVDLPSNYREVTQHVERTDPESKILFYTGDLLRANQPSKAEYRSGGDLIDAQTDVLRYTAVSRIEYVTAAQMRAAGNDFPEGIRQRYLNLPDELPQRVRDLALNLTADKINLYDRAKAIETYLRQFPYSVDVPAPPSHRDVADYFLFDLKKGYCDYFATTMVVMARAAGMPARLVTGYSSGDYDYNAHHFVVVAANSHAWVEIYFPGLGWVEFEPTTNLSTISHPGGSDNPANAVTRIPTPVPAARGFGFDIPWDNILPPLALVISILAAMGILLLVLPVESWVLSLQPPDKAINSIYQRLYRRSRVWGVEADATRTPNEFARALSTRLKQFVRIKKLAPRIKTMLNDLHWLTGIYNRQLFSPLPLTPEEHRQAVQAWGRMRRGLARLQRG